VELQAADYTRREKTEADHGAQLKRDAEEHLATVRLEVGHDH
jgi:hypothetical protein